MVPSYNGPSSFLLFSKYNNYANAGNDSGDGVNRVALLDPNSTQVDAHASSNGMSIMREVLTVIGPTADPENRSASAPTRSANGASTPLCIGHEFCCQQWKHHSARSEHHCYNHCNYFFREAPVQGTSAFAMEFAAAGPRDKIGRSLRDLDLNRRMFRYPCSFLIYSEAFDALPKPALDYFYRRLWDVLTEKTKTM